MHTLEYIETEIDNLTCAFVDMLDNDPNEDEHTRVCLALQNLREVADELLD